LSCAVLANKETAMRMKFLLLASATMMASSLAYADSQSSNTSSNRSSNNGIVRERIVDTYCEDGYCERYVLRRTYRENESSRRYRDYVRRHHRDRYMGDDDNDDMEDDD
jgi:hypothetical protein